MNLPFGIDQGSTYDQFAVKLGPDDLVVVYTDALTEAMSPTGEMLGEKGLISIARQIDLLRPEEIGPALLAGVREHRGGVEADDDVTLLVLRHNAAPPRKPGVAERLEVYAKVFGLKGV